MAGQAHSIRAAISIHALREEGDVEQACENHRTRPISIHALREEGDQTASAAGFQKILFLSTPSARRATVAGGALCPALKISIHALREEGDIVQRPRRRNRAISIHALREEGDGGFYGDKSTQNNFYPRPPRGGRRDHPQLSPYHQKISIHALREEGDLHS